MSFKNCNKFKRLIDETDWTDVYHNLDTNAAFNNFHKKLKWAYDRAFPKRKMTKTYHTWKPWLTEALKISIKIKNKMYISYKKGLFLQWNKI